MAILIGTSYAQSQNTIHIAAEKGDVEKVNNSLLMNPEENIQSVEDPNQRWQNNALMAVSDPNGIYKRIEEYNLKQAKEELDRSGKEEQRAWLTKATSQRTRLVRAVQKQILAEISFIKGIAKDEHANQTMVDANGIILVWERRLDFISERLREMRRQEQAQASGRPYVPPVAKTTSRPYSSLGAGAKKLNTSNEFYEEGRLSNEKEQLASIWVTSSLDNTEQLARDVNVIMLRDLGYLRIMAKDANASEKILTAIDTVILMRTKRSNEVIAEIQIQVTAQTALSNTGVVGPTNSRIQGRRGYQQNAQDAMTGNNRSNRRNRY